jgi:hypothetical protein
MLRKKTRLFTLLPPYRTLPSSDERSGRGTITSITLTPANPTTMSNAHRLLPGGQGVRLYG